MVATLAFFVVLGLYMTCSGSVHCEADMVSGDKVEHVVESTKVEIFSLDESSNQLDSNCECDPCSFNTFSVLEWLVIAIMGAGVIAAVYKSVVNLKNKHRLKQEKKKLKKAKQMMEMESQIVAKYRDSVGTAAQVETIELTESGARQNLPGAADTQKLTYEPQT